MKIGKLYKARQFHHTLDDFGPEKTIKRKVEFDRLIDRSSWDPESPWVLSLNVRDGWNLGAHDSEVITVTPGQIVMVLTVERIPQNEVTVIGLLINEQRFVASFRWAEWLNRFEEVQ